MINHDQFIFGQTVDPNNTSKIFLNDPTLQLDLVASGLNSPINITFIDRNDFLILEKKYWFSQTNSKTIHCWINPLLTVPLNTKNDGFLGFGD